MVIGGGMLAGAFCFYDEVETVVVLAAGVSNSNETSHRAFGRERRLVEQTLAGIGNKLLVYFSTCSVYDPDAIARPYVQHKLNIERIVSENAADYLVFRLPQVVGNTSNPATLTNYLYNRIVGQQRFDIWNKAYRCIIDVADVARIATYVIDNGVFKNKVVNIAPRPYLVTDILRALERILGKEAVCTYKMKGCQFDIETDDISQILKELKIEFGPDYLFRVLSKYYGPIS